jgi:hypothetical protein
MIKILFNTILLALVFTAITTMSFVHFFHIGFLFINALVVIWLLAYSTLFLILARKINY